MLRVRLVARDGAKVCGGGVVLSVWVWHSVENDIGRLGRRRSRGAHPAGCGACT
jgi:hypothetical protein